MRDYVNKNGFKNVVLGLSGGIDSAICAALSVDALGEERERFLQLGTGEVRAHDGQAGDADLSSG